MNEQQRAKKSKSMGEKHITQRKWPTITSAAKAHRTQKTSGRKKKSIELRKQDLTEKLSELYKPETIKPKFSLTTITRHNKTIVSIQNGEIGYHDFLLKNINLSLTSDERMAIEGQNGCGKSTLIKGILGTPTVIKKGEWSAPSPQDIGYLDQHYQNLDLHKTVFETIQELMPGWSPAQIRRHLNDFLFCKNEAINVKITHLSGGEKARLSLCHIAAKTPKLLILDEITNNLDLETKEHVIKVLNGYPGGLIIISHEPDFLKAINITQTVNVNQFLKED